MDAGMCTERLFQWSLSAPLEMYETFLILLTAGESSADQLVLGIFLESIIN